jgi:acetyl esterase/lipase
MPFKLDPEVGAAMAALSPPGQEPPPPPAIGDITSRRNMVDVMFTAILPPMPSDVSTKDFHITTSDGHKLLLRWYTKNGSEPSGKTPAVAYYHGGGLIAGSVNLYNPTVAGYVSNTGVPFLSVDYRLAPEFPYPTPIHDAYAGLVWLHENASKLGIDATRIAVMGDSAGGLVAAAVTHFAKEKRGPGIAKQILIYPMLDDRNISHDAQIGPYAVWSSGDNETAWNAILGARRGTSNVPPTAAPARMTDATGLPPLYLEVGELDIFRVEDVEYAAKFGKAGITAELHVHPGCPHGFEVFAQNSDVAKRAMQDRYRAVSNIEPLETAGLAAIAAKL